MRRAVPFLATVLLAGAIENVAGQEIEIVASADTVVLKVTIEPQDFDYAEAKQNLDVARKERDAKVAAVDALVNEMVKKSFDGGKVSDERQYSCAVSGRRVSIASYKRSRGLPESPFPLSFRRAQKRRCLKPTETGQQ
jgi:hypothetical protein